MRILQGAAAIAVLTAVLKANAGTQLLAITGDGQPGAAGAQLQSIASAALNDSGQAALLGTLKVGVGGVTTASSGVAWQVDGGGKQSLARTASSGAPGASSDAFATLQAISIDDAGTAALSGALASGKQGVWRYPSGSGSLVALTNSGSAPGVPGAPFEQFLGGLMQSAQGTVVINGRLPVGVGGVTTNTRRGVWMYDGAVATLVARESLTDVPSVPGGKFSAPTATSVNASSQAAVISSLGIADEITLQNNLGVWRLDAGGGQLAARRGVGNVGGVAGASFLGFDNVTINSAGHLAFNAELMVSGAVTPTNNLGIWKFEGGANHLVARNGAVGVPGVLGADFASFGAPLLNDADQILFRATLAPGVGGVDEANSVGLWSLGALGNSLIARTNNGGVPGIAGASFADFGTLAFNASGVAAVRGMLNPGPGGVSAANDVGLWLLNGSGGGVLVAREGGTLAGRTIADLDFLGGSAGGDGHGRALNNSGQLLFKATFTNGDQGLFLYFPASSADFNSDGQVNGADLAAWKDGFGAHAGATVGQGDADRDGNVDGADFLLWQRQVSAGGGATTVPESPAFGMFLCGIATACLRLKRGVI